DGKISFSERLNALNIYALARAPEIMWGFRKKLKPPSGWTYRSAQDTSSRVAVATSILKEELSERASDYEILRFAFDCVCRRSWFKSTSRMAPDEQCWCGSGKLYKNCHKIIAEQLQYLRSVFEVDKSGNEDAAGCARMLQYLLLDFGIPCITMTGSMMTGNRENAFTWNYVRIDGVWNIVNAAMGSCNLQKYPALLANCPDWAKDDYVRYRYMCADGKDYEPAPTIPAPSIGDSSDYFINEGNLLSRDDVPSFVRCFARLLSGLESFVGLKCPEGTDETGAWINKTTSVARGAFVAAKLDYDRLCANLDMYIKASSKQANVDRQLSSSGICNSWTKWMDSSTGIITICLQEQPPVRR
ncbi:MAG: SEC-C domain-containing protein, partial [Eggerthellaceae bacterium]|nr:SEC-C domain-containing protein [Eggerthellaceae bacterium]